MLRTKLFQGRNNGMPYHEYSDFINANQSIQIISVNILRFDFVMLTYKE